jgi:nickel-dependent lactate racemase
LLPICVSYGDRQLRAKISKEQRLTVLEPKIGDPINDLRRELEYKLVCPTAGTRLKELVGENSQVVIIVDDNTRPTPTPRILGPILEILASQKIPDENITMIFALGAHRKLKSAERQALVGDDIFRRYQCVNHEAEDPASLVELGKTSFGTPVILNKKVYEADVRILTGIIKPHNQAGYSGGGKSLLPGVCGLATIASNHSFRAIADPKSCLGVIDDNPIRQDIEETLKWVGPTFIVNLVMNCREEVVAVVSGDPIKAHREGASILASLAECPVSQKADLCICGTPDPIDINFYQMLNSLSAPYRLAEPVLNHGGAIIVAGRAVEGISDGDFYMALKQHDYHSLWQKIKFEEDLYRERPALQIFMEGALEYQIVVVSEVRHQKLFEDMGLTFYADLQAAVDRTLSRYSGVKNVLALPEAPFVIPKLVEKDPEAQNE